MDYQLLQSELLRSFRGRHSQAKMSRKLGYRSNVVFDWESARRQPSAAKAFKYARMGGLDVRAALRRFTGLTLEHLKPRGLESDAGVAALMRQLRGAAAVTDLATQMRVSRYTLGRWLKAQVSPSFAELLHYVQVTTLRVVDLCAELADPLSLSAISQEWQRLDLARELAYEHPWSHAVLRVLELSSYLALERHEPGFIARRLGISQNEEKKLLHLLEQSGQIKKEGQRYVLVESRAVDTRKDQTRSRQLRAFFCEVAADQLRKGSDGEFSFSLFGVSFSDLERLKALQRSYYAELRRIVGQSEPVEAVVLTNIQLLTLSR